MGLRKCLRNVLYYLMQLFEPAKVVERVIERVVSKEGEVTVNLNISLTLKLEDGALKMTPQIQQVQTTDKVDIELPDMEGGELISFGKEVK